MVSAAMIISLLAGVGIVLAIVVVVLIDQWAQKATHDPRNQRSHAQHVDDARDEFLE